MNILTTDKRVSVISALVEGCSIRSTVRLTGVAKDTVLKLLGMVGEACLEYQDHVLRNLPCKRLECDEIWAFCYAKDKNLPEYMRHAGRRVNLDLDRDGRRIQADGLLASWGA